MTEIQAGQHIYASVEKEQSPAGRGGFQTLCYTHTAITAEEIEEIEPRLLYYPADAGPVKHLYFSLSSGKAILARIVPFPERDSAGREGRYLAHSLVLKSEDLSCLGPRFLGIWEGFPFASTVEEALALCGPEPGDMPEAAAHIPDQTAGFEEARLWPLDEFKKWLRLALRVDGLASERMAVALVGDPEQAHKALAAILPFVPSGLLPRCSFDTYFYRCNLVSAYFWAVGLPEPPGGLKFKAVDARARRVTAELEEAMEISFERWMAEYIGTEDMAFYMRHREAAYSLCEWLDGRREAPEEGDAPLLQSVLSVNWIQAKEKLTARLSERLPSALVYRLTERPPYPPRQQFYLMKNGVTSLQAVELLYYAYAATSYAVPPRDEMQALGKLLEEADHQDLRLLYLSWKGQKSDLRKLLESAREEAYAHQVRTLLDFRILDPVDFLIPGKGAAFISAYRSSGIRSLAPVVSALVSAREAGCLSALVPDLPALPPEELLPLQKLAARNAGLPEPFRQVVAEAAKALPHKKGLLGLLKGLLGKYMFFSL
ncbi:MAG: hypothetical protein IT210_13625 [Armatimonadetes bacterium]|nr:hypothetical protein [Armatimonadota bacterium]